LIAFGLDSVIGCIERTRILGEMKHNRRIHWLRIDGLMFMVEKYRLAYTLIQTNKLGEMSGFPHLCL